MKILAIDSSAAAGSVAIYDDGKLIAEAYLNISNTHSETLLCMIECALKHGGVDVSDIDMFACTNGPGSFTGIRIGVSIIKGLAFGTGKPCIGVSALEAAAYPLKEMKGIILPVMDARRGCFYNALFESDGQSITRVTQDSLDPAKAILEKALTLAKEKKLSLYFCGDGYDAVRSMAKGARVKDTPEMLRIQRAIGAAEAAAEKYESAEDKTKFTDLELAAVYLRATQAERERLEKETQNNLK